MTVGTNYPNETTATPGRNMARSKLTTEEFTALSEAELAA
jgi:hypothetical protein